MILVGDRPPDVLVGGRIRPYMRRWWIIPRNRFLNIYLHEFLRSDDERALHDHPWWSLSFLLQGELWEHLQGLNWPRKITAPAITLRSAAHAHRLEILGRGSPEWVPPVTLFVTGPKIREWGFLCPAGWRHWTLFTEGYDPETGDSRGCES